MPATHARLARGCASARRTLLAAGLVPALLATLAPTRQAGAQQRAGAARAAVRTPDAALGMDVGADRTLADWAQIVRYFRELDTASPAMVVQTLGETTEQRPFLLAAISSPRNIARLETI